MAEEKLFTQEEVNKLVGTARLEGKESGRKEFDGWISPEALAEKLREPTQKVSDLEAQIETLNATISESKTKLAEGEKYRTDLEKTRIALAAGLKIDYADRLKGETPEEWKADAELLAKDFASFHQTAPLSKNEPRDMNSDPDKAASKMFADWAETNLKER